MKTGLWIGLGIVAVIALVFIALAVGWAVWGRPLWAAGTFAVPAGCGGQTGGAPSGRTGRGYGVGPGMMGGGSGPAAPGGCGGSGSGMGPGMMGWSTAPLSGTLTIEQARDAVEQYVAGLGYPNLEVVEVMEFERNFYAIVQESDTSIGAMEVLVDKASGVAGPEMGPNMMWNSRYGMHGRGNGTNTISSDEAVQIAQRWLDANRPGVTVEDADPFYGYYTVHTLKDGQIEGMLSVHGTTGQVWYHTWHGPFIQMIEEEE